MRATLDNAKVKIETKTVDAVFDTFDKDRGGTLDANELKAALHQLKKESEAYAKVTVEVHARVARLRERAAQVREAAGATLLAEQAAAQRAELLAHKSIDSRLGGIIKLKGMKVDEMIRMWDADRSGKVDRKEFHGQIAELGVDGSEEDIDALFDAFDEDDSGYLDLTEMKHAYVLRRDLPSLCCMDRFCRDIKSQPYASTRPLATHTHARTHTSRTCTCTCYAS